MARGSASRSSARERLDTLCQIAHQQPRAGTGRHRQCHRGSESRSLVGTPVSHSTHSLSLSFACKSGTANASTMAPRSCASPHLYGLAGFGMIATPLMVPNLSVCCECAMRVHVTDSLRHELTDSLPSLQGHVVSGSALPLSEVFPALERIGSGFFGGSLAQLLRGFRQNTQDGVGWLSAFAIGCFPAVEVGREDEVGGGGCPLVSPGVGLGLDVLVEVGWDSDGDAFGGGVLVGDFPVGCGVGCEAFGEELSEYF